LKKVPLFIPSIHQILVKKTRQFNAREENRLTSVGSNLLRQRPHGVDSFPMRPPEPGPLLPPPCEHHKWMAINQV